MLTLDQVKDFMRISTAEEDALLSSLLSASATYIKNATNPDADPENELFQVAQRMLIHHWHENPDLTGKSEKLPHHLDSILMQVAYADPLTTTDGSSVTLDSGTF